MVLPQEALTTPAESAQPFKLVLAGLSWRSARQVCAKLPECAGLAAAPAPLEEVVIAALKALDDAEMGAPLHDLCPCELGFPGVLGCHHHSQRAIGRNAALCRW